MQGAPVIFVLAQAVILLRLLALLVPIGWASLTVGRDGLLVRDRWSRIFVPYARIEPILVAIEAERQRHAASDLAHDDRLARAGRPLAAWRAELENPSAFRSFTPSPEELRAVLASPTAPLDERVGAALALRRVPGEGNARIRVAASVTAHPELRVALETLAEEELDEARLDSALAVAHRALR